MSVFNKQDVFGEKNSVDFSISYVQFLSSQGELQQEVPEYILDREELIKAYRTMVLIRAFDQKAIALQRTGKIGTYPSVLGQEAIGTAIGMAMHMDDVFAPYYRDFATQYLRGVSLSEMLLYWGGSEQGSNYSNCPNDFPVCVPIATQFGHAAGASIALKSDHLHRASVVTSGEGATSKGDFLETLNLAGAWQLPLVMVINNNQWAISTPRTIQTGAMTIAQKAIGAGIEGMVVDGNDFLALRFAIDHALQKAYSGKGATLIEAVSYRLGDHTTADDASRYRAEEELKSAWDREPIKRLKVYLEKHHSWSLEEEKKLLREVKDEINAAVESYERVPSELPESMFDYLYESLPAPYRDQYARARLKGMSFRANKKSPDGAKKSEEVRHD